MHAFSIPFHHPTSPWPRDDSTTPEPRCKLLEASFSAKVSGDKSRSRYKFHQFSIASFVQHLIAFPFFLFLFSKTVSSASDSASSVTIFSQFLSSLSSILQFLKPCLTLRPSLGKGSRSPHSHLRFSLIVSFAGLIPALTESSSLEILIT